MKALQAAFVLPVLVHAFPQASSSASSSTATAPASTTSSTPVVTSTPQPSFALNATLPSQAALPPKQAWCPSDIFCAGELLQTLNIAEPYADSKTIVDKPTNKSSQAVLNDFNAIAAPGLTAITENSIVTFLGQDFRGEGLELEAQNLTNFNPNPAFLNNVTDPVMKAWTQTVHGYWTSLIRGTNASALCREGNSTTCESTLIPLNHTFVVPGGRFREQYYWDSYWIIEGLIKSELLSVANDTLQNFMDELDTIGFIPNGGRIYYLARSQPPLFIHMLSNYVAASNDTSILTRALPLAEKELAWWADNRSLNVTSPYTNNTHFVARYSVNNSAPRPESYLADYLVTNGPDLTTAYTEQEQADLYAELASGAETGWDYSSRFAKQPLLNITNNTPALRTLNIRANIPVDLNSILYRARLLLADLYEQSASSPTALLATPTSTSSVAFPTGTGSPASRAAFHRSVAADIKSAILDLFWDPTRVAFYDFNTTANARGTAFTAATFYPLWNGITPPEILSNATAAQAFFSSVNMVLNRYNGTFPVTFLTTGLQWDAPNAWPPHQYIIVQALQSLPSNITSGAFPTPPSNQSTFALVPNGQIPLSETELPVQSIEGGGNVTATSGPDVDINAGNGTVFNGGNSTSGEGWRDTMVRELTNRFMSSAFCSWYVSGGSLPGLLSPLPADELLPGAAGLSGLMFEKFSINDVSSAGRGGEYTVQAGFGWTNGVVLFLAGELGQIIARPSCPTLVSTAASNSSSGSGGSGSSGGGSSSGAESLRGSLGFESLRWSVMAILGLMLVTHLLL
ncbi:glycoside hydrolase [Sistotremastrum suecicum HHB10207 ss-3]|uniref:Trehalase n=1 Tax=Sistotremastrum suecicum HHB10207 ss-3 TaxID=1314776 RepID=A0A166AK03_9AGAM|nr:glycoside hydrolase [Sistotremastrum suecicum HHB10207 ss-3]